MTEALNISEVGSANKKFWNEPCETNSYNYLGFDSEQDFDAWFFRFRSYLEEFIQFSKIKGKKVLEVGLDMGSVSERLGKVGADFYGMDIAEGAVECVNKRFLESGFEGKALIGDILNCPWEDNFFDNVISIGCIHRRGDFYKTVEELVRVQNPGRQGVFMFYNAFSYRQWFTSPIRTLMKSFTSVSRSPIRGKNVERGMYDTNSKGEAAPSTEFLSRKEIAQQMNGLRTKVKISCENIGSHFMFPLPRF